MSRVLLVDDDPVVQRLYGKSLAVHGYQVQIAADGPAALNAMRADKPDLVVLDLMMPKLSGADVLKMMRTQPELASVPVIVLSNAYMGGVAAEAAAAGAQMGLLKVSCTPSILLSAMREILEGQDSGQESSKWLAVPRNETAPAAGIAARAPEPSRPGPSMEQPKPRPAATVAAAPAQSVPPRDDEVRADVRTQLLESAKATCAGLRAAHQAFSGAPEGDQRNLRLVDLYRKVHFLTASAGLADFPRLAQMTTAFEALLFRLMDDPKMLTASAARTISATIDFVETLFQEAREGKFGRSVLGQVLVVDDDPVSNRLVVWALTQAGLHARSANVPEDALQRLKAKRYDLVLLDIEMPGMDGFEFCRQLRLLPGYAKTPVIYVTAHSDFDSRSKSVLAGGDDLIGKPLLPMELAVKAVMHLLREQK